MNNNGDKTKKLYRHEALLYAIDFFSQGFNRKQTAKYAFDFVNEILTLNASAIFLREDDKYVLHRSRKYNLESYKIDVSKKLDDIGRFHGNIIKSNFPQFLAPKEIEVFNPKLIIPLIVQDRTLGFIISNGKAMGEFNSGDFNIATTLMRLINSSFENTLFAKEVKEKNKELDLQIFNLFFINQTTKNLLSELDIEEVYTLCTDIIGEVACSKITTFGLYDEISENIVIRSYRDIFSFSKYYTEFELLKDEYDSNNIILHYERDRETIKGIFKNWEEFEKLDTEYIILIVRDKVLGFITISKPVNDREYNSMMFDLIESLSSIIYIAINNAKLFKRIGEQKRNIEKKFNIVQRLGKIIKSINSSSSVEEISNRVMRTLNIGFNIQKGFMVFKQNGKYEIINRVGFDTEIKAIDKTDVWNEIDDKGIIYEFSSANNEEYFGEELCRDIGDSNCIVISPIMIDNMSFDREENILGYIVVSKTKKSLEPEEIVLIDTISGSIAPVIKQLNYTEEIKKEYIINQQEMFLKELKEKLYNKENYYIDFKVYYKKIVKKPFEDIDLSAYAIFKHYFFDNYLFVLSEYELCEEDFDGDFELNTFDEVYEIFNKI
ncbi:hypothetical protein R9X47_24530 [Wukongibacter baidiensis]|uniref:hypothetical protein n=1 Tax=Wukongibacter baidiensis TaxID=1723361 RepID=UPI003D7FF101